MIVQWIKGMNGLVRWNFKFDLRAIYLAILITTYNAFLQRPLVQKIIEQNQLKFIIYEQNAAEIVKWINYSEIPINLSLYFGANSLFSIK